MTAAEAAREATMLIGMIEMVVTVVTALVMPNPAAVGMHVRGVRMSIVVIE